MTPASATTWSRPRSATSRTWSATRACQSAAIGPQLGGVDGRVEGDLGDAGLEAGEQVEEGLAVAPAGRVANRSAKSDALLGGQLADREARRWARPRRPSRRRGRREVDGQLEVDVEELRPQQQGVEVGVEVADVESPQDGPLDLGPALAAHLVQVGVVPDVGDRAGKAPVPVEQRRGLGDRTPSVEVVLGVEGEPDPDVVTAEPRRRLAGPGGRDDERGAGADAVAEGVVDPDGGRVAEAEVGAVEDQQLGLGG